MNLAEKIKSVCFDDGKRFVPKRNLNWLKINYPNIATEIEKSFGDKYTVSFVYKLLNSGINSLDEVPLCQVCRQNKISLSRNVIRDVCSVSCSSKMSAEKTNQTCMSRYGKKRNFGNKVQKYNIGEHHTQKNIKNLHLTENNDFMLKLQSKSNWKLVSRIFGLTNNSHSSAYRFMTNVGYPMNSISGKSNLETELYNFVLSLDSDAVRNTKSVIKPYELDVYSEKHNIAIEFNGSYYHSSGSKCDDTKMSKLHITKTELCESKNIHLFHIFENEWTDNTLREIWKSKLRVTFGKSERKIFARKCIKKTITYSEAKEFCVKNHLQGSVESGKMFEGLFHEDKLVMVVILGKSRYNSKYEYELLRMCSELNTIVVGGASRLLKPYNFISYGNRRWCNFKNNVYSKFAKYIGSSGPCYWYVDKGSVCHRSKFMKHKLAKLFGNFDSAKTEVENCYNNGLRRIWDCGNLIFVKNEE